MIQHSHLASSDERQQGSSLGEKAIDSSNDDLAMLFLFSSPCRSGMLVCNPSTHNYFLSINVSIDVIYANQT
jgi:hypothetical protein